MLLLPYHPAEQLIPTPDGFDGTFYPPGMESVPRKNAIERANRCIKHHVDYMNANIWHLAGGVWKLLERAQRGKFAFIRTMLVT